MPVAAALVIVSAGAITTVLDRPSQPVKVHALLVEAVGDTPPLRGRLVGFRYGPSQAEGSSEAIPAASRVRTRVEKLGSHLRGLRVASHPLARHTLALAELMMTESGTAQRSVSRDRAIAAMRVVIEGQPENAWARSDLAALLIDRASEETGVDDLVEAAESAQLAMELAPTSTEAHYNLALACDRLFLWYRAREQYAVYLEREHDAEWIAHAAARVAELSALLADPGEGRAMDRRLEESLLNGTESELARLVRQAPELARDLGMNELLPVWAAAVRAGEVDIAASAHHYLHRLGRVIADVSGDHLVLDAMEALAADQDRSIAEGFITWGLVAPVAKRRSYERAANGLADVIRLLEPSGNPMVLEAKYYLAVFAYQQGQYQRAHDALELLASAESVPRYPSLQRKIARMRGTIHHVWGNLETARYYYSQAVDLGRACRDSDAVASDQLLLALLAHNLGTEDATGLWWSSARGRATVRREDYSYSIFATGADLLAVTGRVRSALLLRQEAVAIGEETDDPVVQTDSHLKRAEAELRLRSMAEALTSLRSAEILGRQIESISVRQFMDMEVLRLRAVAVSELAPSRAAALLHDVAKRVEEMRYWRLLPRILLVEGELLRETGRTKQAEEKFLSAAARIREQAENITDLEEKITFLGEAVQLHDELAWLAWDRDDFVAALSIYNEARSLSEWLHTVGDPDNRRTYVRPASPREALLAYGFRKGRTIVWLSTNRVTRSTVLAISQAEVEREIEGLEEHWKNRDHQRVRSTLRMLYRELVAPVETDLRDAEVLRVIPYDVLGPLPFSALLESDDRSLLERFEVVLAFSLPEDDRLDDATAMARVDYPKLLTVGDPAFSSSRYADLPRLAAARDEVRMVREVYGGGVHLVDRMAKKSTVIELLPKASVAHFAVHARIDQERPLRSHLVLAPSPYHREESAGFFAGGLSARDVIELDLSGLQVAVLSACETAKVSAVRKGIGVGLAVAFLGAGAEAVIAGPWQQPDGDGSEVLVEFHRRFHDGATASQALRAAKLEAISESSADGWLSTMALEVYEN